MYALSTSTVPSLEVRMNEIGDGMDAGGRRVRLITCKAYSGVSSEAMGPNWKHMVVHSRVRTDRHCVGR